MGVSWKKLKDTEYHTISLTFAEAKGVRKEFITKKSDFICVLKRATLHLVLKVASSMNYLSVRRD